MNDYGALAVLIAGAATVIYAGAWLLRAMRSAGGRG